MIAIRWAGKVNAKKAWSYIKKCLLEKEGQARTHAIQALPEFGERLAVPILKKIIGDKKDRERNKAIYSFLKIADKRHLLFFKGLLLDENDKYIKSSIEYFVKQGGKKLDYSWETAPYIYEVNAWSRGYLGWYAGSFEEVRGGILSRSPKSEKLNEAEYVKRLEKELAPPKKIKDEDKIDYFNSPPSYYNPLYLVGGITPEKRRAILLHALESKNTYSSKRALSFLPEIREPWILLFLKNKP